MSKENRQHVRTKLRAKVKLTHPDTGELLLHTGDVSDGGAYVVAEGQDLPEIGQVVNVQMQGIGEGEAPIVKMKVVRLDKGGIGLEFVNKFGG